MFVIALAFSVSEGQMSSYSYYRLTEDPRELDLDAPDRISEKLGAKLLSEDAGKAEGVLRYQRKAGVFPTYSYSFSYRTLSYPSDTTVRIFGSPFVFKANQPRVLYGFDAMTGEFSAVSYNLSLILMSAYLQETDNSYAKNPNHFVMLPSKSRGEFWKRNLLSMGYASQYMTRDNPFMSAKWFINGFAYVWDGFGIFMVAAGPFIGSTRTDRIALPVIGISNILFWRGLVYGLQGDKEIREYNRIIESGYQMPKGLAF